MIRRFILALTAIGGLAVAAAPAASADICVLGQTLCVGSPSHGRASSAPEARTMDICVSNLICVG